MFISNQNVSSTYYIKIVNDEYVEKQTVFGRTLEKLSIVECMLYNKI